MITSTETKDVFSALVKCQSEIDSAVKDKVNPAFRSTYADLASVIEAAREPLKNAGLALTIGLVAVDSGVALEAFLVHVSGQFIKYDPFAILITKKDAQGQGSAITYGRRYLTMSILGIPAEDADANASTGAKPKQEDAQTRSSTTGGNSTPTLRDEVKAYLSEIKPRLTSDQVTDLSRDFRSAGTTPALLNGVMEKAKRIMGGEA